MNRRHFLQQTIYLALAVSSLTLPACSDAPNASVIPAGSTVVALGDSLTFGYGADADSNYPTILAQLTSWKVVNAGINGDTSAGVRARSDAIIAQNPDLVLLGVGGNDVLQRVPEASTVANISATIDKFAMSNIPVVLIAEPHLSTSALFGKASDNPIYKDIAQDKGVALFAKDDGGWSYILSDEQLKSDQIHANNAGYRLFANNLYEFLLDTGFAN